MTGRDLVSASLRLIGAIASGEALESSEATDGLAALNRMIASWSTESLLVSAKVRELFSLVPSQQAYTMGVGGNFNTSRPQRIDAAGLKFAGVSPSVEIPLKILNMDQWAAIVTKDITSSNPLYMYPEGTNPLETLNVWPIPTVAHSLVLYSWKPLAQLSTIDDVLAFAPGYDEALIYNLSIRLAPEFGRSAPAEVVQIASEAKAAIKRMNHKPQYLQVDDALRSGPRTFNWITGESQ